MNIKRWGGGRDCVAAKESVVKKWPPPLPIPKVFCLLSLPILFALLTSKALSSPGVRGGGAAGQQNQQQKEGGRTPNQSNNGSSKSEKGRGMDGQNCENGTKTTDER